MSVEAMANCWGDDFPAHGCEKVHPSTVRLVGLAIADVVNDLNDNLFFAKLSTIAAKVDLHRDTVRLVMRHLVSFGVLDVIDEAHPGSTNPGVYRWVWISHNQRSKVAEIPRPRTRANTKGQVEGRGRSATGRGLFRDQVADCSATYTNRDQLNSAPTAANGCSTCGGTMFLSQEVEVGDRLVWESTPCDCHPMKRSAAAKGRSR